MAIVVFCGSKNYPNRGYLDALAHRQLTSGTTASTKDDYTMFGLIGAGEEGIRNVAPVFLDHILQPLLSEEQFMTEVCIHRCIS